MDLLQKDINDMMDIWNAHLIRKQARVINGIPNELYYLPHMRGLIHSHLAIYAHCIMFVLSGYQDCSYMIDEDDITLLAVC